MVGHVYEGTGGRSCAGGSGPASANGGVDQESLKGKVARILSDVMGISEDQIDEGSSPDSADEAAEEAVAE